MTLSIRRFAYHAFVIAFGVLMIYPILWTISSSLKPENEIFTHAGSLLPSTFEWLNYVQGWAGFGGTNFGVFFSNSAIITVIVVIGTLLSSSLVAYGFARLQFWTRSFLFTCLMITMMLPSQVTLVPQYILFHNLGWVNTFLPLTVPHFIGGSPFFIFLLIQFFRGIPRELDEAAFIDGCNAYSIFGRVILPLAKPALVTVAIFCFLWTWDDFLGPLIYLNNPKLFTVSLGLRMFSDPNSFSHWGYMFAMSILSLLPEFIVFLVFQRNIVEGIATTGLKG
ncbi:MAG: hypothetical protein JWN30_1623 [Bacilli bacterium]|nr:hypothetical protein [Bacilli bacterium]